ncbi:hypothetical protein D3C85_1345750 [compost metagenome]
MLAQRKGINAAQMLPVGQALAQIMLDTCGRLVTLLGGFGEQLHHNVREHPGDGFDPHVGWQRLFGNMAMHPFDRVRGHEWQRAGQHLVQRDAEGIEVAARIDRAVHLAGLLGCHIGERAGDGFGRLSLAGQP